MKRTTLAVCACLVIGTTASFAQDRSNEDTQTPSAVPSPPANGTPNGAAQERGTQGGGAMPGDATQDKNAMRSGHQGQEGVPMPRKQCLDLRSREAQNLQGADPAKDRACAKILGGNSGNSMQSQ